MSADGALVNAETGEIIAECTPDEARLLCERMHTGLGVLTELYVEAYQRRAWAALGYSSWDAFLAAEFGKYQLRLPSEERDETVMSLRAAGLSIRAIAATGVASKKTVERTIAASGVANDDTSTTGTDGKTYQSKAVANLRSKPEPDTQPETPTKCTDGFDCPSTPGADGLCGWHRKRRAEAAQDPGKAGVGSPSDAAAPGDTEGTGPTVAHPDGDEGDAVPPAASPSLPDDWAKRLADATYLLSIRAETVAALGSADDIADLTDLAAWLLELSSHLAIKEHN